MEPDAPGVAAGPLEVGCRFGGCVVEGVLGSGANGWVYLGRQVSLQRPVAIKVLRSRGVESRARERFLQEGRLAGRLQHPGLVRIFDVGEQDELLYLVYELVEGGTLRDRFRDGPPIDAAVAVSIARSLAQALQAVHAAGVLHRDLKPENIFMSGRGPLLGDLGLAKDTMSSGIQTTQGFVVGTPAYLAPEVIQGEVYAPPADLYALGLVFFECLTGKFAFYDENPGNLLMLHICGQIPDPRSVREDLPGELTEFVRRALAKHPADRFADAGRFLEALSRLPGDEPAPASERPRPPHHGPTTKPVAVRQPRLRGPAAATRKGQPAPRAIRVLAAAGPRLMVAGACLALALAAAMLVWRAGGESREGPGSVAKPAPATDPTARVVHTTARRTVPSRDSVQLAARALAARTKDVRNRVSRLLSMRGSAGAPLTASEARQVVTAWLREAMDAAAKVLGTSLALAAAGDALGERQVALVLLDLFATYDACMGRLQDVVYAGPGRSSGDDPFGLKALTKVTAEQTRFARDCASMAARLLALMPPDEMRRAEPFVDCGVVFLLTVMRPGTPVGAQSRQMLERATKLAVRAGTALLDPARDGVWDADLLDGLLQALRLLGAHSTALDLCIQAMPAYVKPGIASARLSSFRAELIRFEVEFARIRLQLRPDDLASTTTERQECLRALVALRDRMLLGWPRSPEALRALLPQSARSPDEVQALLMASQRRLSRLRDALRRVTEKLELEMPPEPQGGHPGPGMR